jgi:hypothetical protein
MKVAILAGGLGTRLSEETSINPKPVVEIGGRPILWHSSRTGYNLKVTNMQAAIGCAELTKLDSFIGKRKANFAQLTEMLKPYEEHRILPPCFEPSFSLWEFIQESKVHTWNKSIAFSHVSCVIVREPDVFRMAKITTTRGAA